MCQFTFNTSLGYSFRREEDQDGHGIDIVIFVMDENETTHAPSVILISFWVIWILILGRYVNSISI